MIYGIFKSTRKAKFILCLIAAFFLLINDIKYIIMLNPVALADVHFLNTSNMGTAGLYLSKVNGSWVFKTLFKFIFVVILSIYFLKKKNTEIITKDKIKRVVLFIIPLFILIVFFKISYNNPLFMVKHFYNKNYEEVLAADDYGILYYEQGLYQGIIYNLYASNIHRPDNYKKEDAINAISAISNNTEYNKDFGKPNIVLILSESFSDVTNVEEITFDKDILSNIHNFDTMPNALVTNTYVSTFGGSSVISEWEVITASSNKFNPAGYIAYTAYYHDKNKELIDNSPNIIRLLNNEGYITKYLTPWAGESYNSSKVYDLMGIDEVKYDLKGKKKGFYLADSEINKSIISELNKDKKTPKLLVYATAENHMPCSLDKFKHYDFNVVSSKLDKENTELIKCYAQGVYDADKALGELYNEIQNIDENTIVIFYGDHLPFITNDKGENSYLLSKYFNTNNNDLNDLRKHTTKGVVFSNYINEFDKSINYINLNYLTSYIYSHLDVRGNEYFKYVDSIRKIVPVFSKTYIYENNETIKFKDMDKNKSEKLKEFRKVQYYSFYDNK